MTDPLSSAQAAPRVGYIMTHYPRLAQTYISGEIDAVERAGASVRTFAMNSPPVSDQVGADAVRRIAQTMYLKASPRRALIALARHALGHPLGTARVAAMALASAGASPRRMIRRMAHLAQAALVAETSRRENLDYVHAHFGLAPATIAWLASALSSVRGRQLPFSFTIHGFHDFVDAAESRLELKARDAKQVFCVSDFTRSQLCCVTEPALWSRFVVARCGVDLSALEYRSPSPPDEVPTVIAVGRLSPEKGFDILVEALSILKREGTPQRLVLVGDGPLRGALEYAAEASQVTDLVEFAGELTAEEVRARLASADLFCLPSFSEGLPISIMEAMAVGVPVVTTWIAGIPELAESGVTALTVPPARADLLADALRRLASDRQLRLRLTEAARRRIEQQHDQARCGAAVAERFAAAVAR
jgi:glycosyltransferase involved in cell wall biosynthesis